MTAKKKVLRFTIFRAYNICYGNGKKKEKSVKKSACHYFIMQMSSPKQLNNKSTLKTIELVSRSSCFLLLIVFLIAES
jgi:hypothetical protein